MTRQPRPVIATGEHGTAIGTIWNINGTDAHIHVTGDDADTPDATTYQADVTVIRGELATSTNDD